MSQPILGSLTLNLMESYSGFDYPGRALIVPLLAPSTSAGGNAVLQSGALGFREAKITWLAVGETEVATARGYYEDLSEQTFTDFSGVDHAVRLTEFSAQARAGDFWDVSATMVERP